MEMFAKIGQLNNTAQKSTSQVLIATLKTTIEMLKDRGYANIQSCQTVEEIMQNMTDNRHIVFGGGNKIIHVYFHNEERVGVKQLRSWVETSTADNIIVISLDGPTAFTRKEAEQNYRQVQFFCFRDMCVNITRHTLVPKHEKIPERARLPFVLSEKGLELPTLYTSDKVAQYYAYNVGDIIRITRTAGVQEPVYFYRLVQSPPAS